MGEMMPAVVVAMIPTLDGHPVDRPLFLIDPDKVAAFKQMHDGDEPGLAYFALDNVMDMRGPLFQRPLFRTDVARSPSAPR
jgi:hypothetical protein